MEGKSAKLNLSEMSKVVIYSKHPCPYCVAAKNYFSGKGIKFTEHDLTNRFDEIAELKKRTGHMTFPQIFIDGELIGGYSDLMSLVGD